MKGLKKIETYFGICTLFVYGNGCFADGGIRGGC